MVGRGREGVILAVAIALAQAPAPPPAEPQESVACDPPAAVAKVRQGDKDAYLCLAETDAAKDVIVAAIDAGGEHPERLTRALALWLLHHDDAAWDPALVRRLSPADRRLLADGVRARRGRKSPVPEHDRVFAQFDWYKPAKGYTDGLLRPVDRANIALADNPPPAPPPAAAEPAASEEAPAEGEPAKKTGLCGCDHAGPASAGLAFLALPALVLRRRC